MSEAEYLDSIYPYTEEYELSLKELMNKLYNKQPKQIRWESEIIAMKRTYENVMNAKKGDVIICPCCGKQLIKKSYQHKFCNTKCKDKYWNIINPRGIMKGEIQ